MPPLGKHFTQLPLLPVAKRGGPCLYEIDVFHSMEVVNRLVINASLKQ